MIKKHLSSGKCSTPVTSVFCIILGSSLFTACSTENHTIIAATGTTIGFEVGQEPTGGVTTVLGYKRAEFARVPSNRPNDSTDKQHQNPKGAGETGEVLMELRYQGSGSDSGIYQRLAVGETAVKQAGASLMFARDDKGEINQDAANALQAVQTIPVSNKDSDAIFADIGRSYGSASTGDKAKIDTVIATITGNKYKNYASLVADKSKISGDTLTKISDPLKAQKLMK